MKSIALIAVLACTSPLLATDPVAAWGWSNGEQSISKATPTTPTKSCPCAPGKCDCPADQCPNCATAKAKTIPTVVIPKTPPTVIPQPMPAATTPVGWHSHTCANGHTWSHRNGDPTASHNCPVCGLYQNVVDTRVTMPVQQTFQMVQPTHQWYIVNGRYQLLPIGGGCANGSCYNYR